MKYFLTAGLLALSTPAFAMEMEYWKETSYGNQYHPATIFMAGPVERGDPLKLTNLLAEHTDVKRVIIGESPGGLLWGGITLAEIIFDHDLEVQVNGPAASAATVISLGAKTTIVFTEETAPEAGGLGTELLFHCAYLPGESECSGPGTRFMSESLAQFTNPTTDEWFNFLMENTSPATLERILLSELLDEQWNCNDAMFSGTTCIREHEIERDRVVLYQELVSLMYPHGFPVLIEGNEFLGSRLNVRFFSEDVTVAGIETTFGLDTTYGSDRNSLCELVPYGINTDSRIIDVNFASAFRIEFTGATFRAGRDGRSVSIKGAQLEMDSAYFEDRNFDLKRAVDAMIVGDYERTQLMLLPFKGDADQLVENLNRTAQICAELE